MKWNSIPFSADDIQKCLTQIIRNFVQSIFQKKVEMKIITLISIVTFVIYFVCGVQSKCCMSTKKNLNSTRIHYFLVFMVPKMFHRIHMIKFTKECVKLMFAAMENRIFCSEGNCNTFGCIYDDSCLPESESPHKQNFVNHNIGIVKELIDY